MELDRLPYHKVFTHLLTKKGDKMRLVHGFAESKAVVQLVLPQPWVTRINQLAIARGVTRSALIREAIAVAYFDAGTAPGQPIPSTDIHHSSDASASDEREPTAC
jgi:hypothetical protein